MPDTETAIRARYIPVDRIKRIECYKLIDNMNLVPHEALINELLHKLACGIVEKLREHNKVLFRTDAHNGLIFASVEVIVPEGFK